jgi:hypothetical protein
MKHQTNYSIIALLLIVSSFFVYSFSLVDKEIVSIYPVTLKAQVSSSLTSGLVAHYTFDEGSGTTANDSAGSNTGTLTSNPCLLIPHIQHHGSTESLTPCRISSMSSWTMILLQNSSPIAREQVSLMVLHEQ